MGCWFPDVFHLPPCFRLLLMTLPYKCSPVRFLFSLQTVVALPQDSFVVPAELRLLSVIPGQSVADSPNTWQRIDLYNSFLPTQARHPYGVCWRIFENRMKKSC